MTTYKYAIIGAMKDEITVYLEQLDAKQTQTWNGIDIHTGVFQNEKVLLVQCGVGKVFAAMICQYIITAYAPQYILFSGVAGALDPSYEIGDIIIGEDCMQHDLIAAPIGFKRGQVPYTSLHYFKAAPELLQIAQTYKGINQRIHFGRILSGDQFISRSERERFDYLDALEGNAIEMEGAAIGQVCTVNNVPFLLIRSISDKADEEASVDYASFFPKVARNNVKIVSYIIQNTL